MILLACSIRSPNCFLESHISLMLIINKIASGFGRLKRTIEVKNSANFKNISRVLCSGGGGGRRLRAALEGRRVTFASAEQSRLWPLNPQVGGCPSLPTSHIQRRTRWGRRTENCPERPMKCHSLIQNTECRQKLRMTHVLFIKVTVV